MSPPSAPGLVTAAGVQAPGELRPGQVVAQLVGLLQRAPELEAVLRDGIALATSRFRASRAARQGRLRVGVCTWDLGHNCAGRAYALAMLHGHHAQVELIGSIFPRYGGSEPWAPLRGGARSLPIHGFVVQDPAQFVAQALALVAAHPFDLVHLSKPRLPNIVFGLLYKLLWGSQVLLDVDDEELAFVAADRALPWDTVSEDELAQAMARPDGRQATRLAVGLVDVFDGITVASKPLRARYGGTLLAHARPSVTEPAAKLRRRGRERLGLPPDARVVLFLGTPRAHKGVLETARAVAALGRPDVVYAVVGGDPGGPVERALGEVAGLRYVIVGPQPLEAAPELAAAADLCVLLQDTASEVARMQMPAKLSDYLSVGAPVLVSDVPALRPAIEAGAVAAVATDSVASLAAAVRNVLEDASQCQRLAARGRAFFESALSERANLPGLEQVLRAAAPRARRPWPRELREFARAALGSWSWLADESFQSPRRAASGPAVTGSVALVVHVDGVAAWPDVAGRLERIGADDLALFVVTSGAELPRLAATVATRFAQARVRAREGAASDLEAFLDLLPGLAAEGVEVVCRVASGGFDPASTGPLEPSFGSRAAFRSVVQRFAAHRELAIAGAAESFLDAAPAVPALGRELVQRVGEAYAAPVPSVWGYFAGGEVWLRPALLLPLVPLLRGRQAATPAGEVIAFGLAPALAPRLMPGARVGLLFATPGPVRACRVLSAASAVQAASRARLADLRVASRTLVEDARLLSDGSVFDADHYRCQRPALPASADAVRDYLLVGRFGRLRPHPAFDAAAYRQAAGGRHDESTGDAFVDFVRRGCMSAEVAALWHGGPQATLRRQAMNLAAVAWPAGAAATRDRGRVSIVIPVYGQLQLTVQCVDSVVSFTPAGTFDIVVVDNGSDAQTREGLAALAARHPSTVTLLRLEENTGFALGCNLGFARTYGSTVIFLNNDTLVTAGWLPPLCKALERDEVGAAQPLLLYPDGKVQCMGVVFSDRSVIGYPLYQGLQPRQPWAGRSRFLQAVTGACMAVRAEDFVALRGFDPVFTNGQEDVDFCLRLAQLTGRRGWLAADSVVIHLEGRSSGRYDNTVSNRRTLKARHGWWIVADDQAHYRADGLVVSGYTDESQGRAGMDRGLVCWRPVFARGPVRGKPPGAGGAGASRRRDEVS